MAAAAVVSSLVTVSLGGCTSAGAPDVVETGYAAPGALATEAAQSSREPTIRVVQDLPPPPDTRGGLDQLISAGDVLKITVFEVDDLSRTVQVDSTGNISLPLIGLVHAAGKTVRALEAEVAKDYGTAYLQSPDVSVFVADSAGQRVTVEGSVKRAGIYPVAGDTTLLQVVAQVGGLSDTANREGVYVFRSHGDQKLAAKYSITAIRAGRASDPRIYGGDIVVAFDSSVRVAQRNLRDILSSATGTATLVRLIP
jgi:polysaccharide biosynthesis/export protein